MREKVKRFLFGGDAFKREFKQQFRLLVTFTLGFTIAFTWRQLIFDSTESLVKFITKVQSSLYLSILTTFTITFISLVIIWLVSKIFEGD